MAKRTQTEYTAAWRNINRAIAPDEPSQESQDRRADLESDTPRWLQYYFPGVFRLPFGHVHQAIIEAADYTIEHGGRNCDAAARGSGKSSVLNGCTLKAVAMRRRRFPVVIPWDAKGLRRSITFWKKALCFNPLLAEDYPELCYPFVHSRGISARLKTYTNNKGDPIGAELLISEGMIVLPDSRGVIGGATINGNPLGLNFTTDKGETLRPDAALIDDPQDREVALSPAQVKNTIELIDKDIAGMAGPDVDMPMMMACTVKERGDVSEHYLNHPEWRAVRIGQILEWPNDMEAWDDWNKARLEGHDNGDGGKAGIAYYKKHKKKLAKGCNVSWEHRYRPGEPDAIFSAMHDYFVMGRAAFMAERQNEPEEASTQTYKMDAKSIAEHVADPERLILPDWAKVFAAHCDINRAGLHFALAGFGNDMTAHVADYGREPRRGDLWRKNAPELERRKAIHAGLSAVCDRIEQTHYTRGGDAMGLDVLLIDAGYETQTVMRFCAQARYPFRVLPARGFPAHKYFPRKSTTVGRPFENCHLSDGQYGRYVAFNADVWRETMQRAFLAEVGAPGGITLFSGHNPQYHRPLAEHIVAEFLFNKYETDAGLRWEWRHKPGSVWDWGDALTGCYVGAAAMGLSAGGAPAVAPKTPRKPLSVRHVKV